MYLSRCDQQRVLLPAQHSHRFSQRLAKIFVANVVPMFQLRVHGHWHGVGSSDIIMEYLIRTKRYTQPHEYGTRHSNHCLLRKPKPPRSPLLSQGPVSRIQSIFKFTDRDCESGTVHTSRISNCAGPLAPFPRQQTEFNLNDTRGKSFGNKFAVLKHMLDMCIAQNLRYWPVLI